MDIFQAVINDLKAGNLVVEQVSSEHLPDWFFDKIQWYASPPTILLTKQDFFWGKTQIGGLAFRHTNEIIIFSYCPGEDREETFAHEVAHFLLPSHFPSHGAAFLAQFACLLEHAGRPDGEIAKRMHECIERNWWRWTPKFLKHRALSRAIKLFAEGAGVPRREPGWVHLLSGGVGCALHSQAGVLLAKVVGPAVLVGGMAGPAAGVAAGGLVAAALLA